MARRLYLGSTNNFRRLSVDATDRVRFTGLPPDARAEDVAKFFDGFGRIIDCRVMTGSPFTSSCYIILATDSHWKGFGFVEFESSKVFSLHRNMVREVYIRYRMLKTLCITSMANRSWGRSRSSVSATSFPNSCM